MGEGNPGDEGDTTLHLTERDIGRVFELTQPCQVLRVTKMEKSRGDKVQLLGLGHIVPLHEIIMPQYISLEPGEYTFAGYATYGPNGKEEYGFVFTAVCETLSITAVYYLVTAESAELQKFRRIPEG